MALPLPSEAPWSRVFNCGDDGALITVTGFDHPTFQLMLELFEPYFQAFTPWTGSQDGFTYKRVNPLKAKVEEERDWCLQWLVWV